MLELSTDGTPLRAMCACVAQTLFSLWEIERYRKYVSCMFGKLATGAIGDRGLRWGTGTVEMRQRAQLNFILSSAGNDERPYLRVSIFDQELLALLDSGASRTVLGRAGWDILRNLGVLLKGGESHCTVANGNQCRVVGEVSVPVRLRDRVQVFDILVVPELPHLLILGTDFWRGMGVVPDLRRGEWVFTSNVDSVNVVKSRFVTTTTQMRLLSGMVDQYFPRESQDRLGCATAIEHKIVTSSAPIKQRYYPISPAMQTIVNQELDKMLDLGVVEPSRSPWSSPILLVPKKDKTYRFCVDYRKLNQATERDAYPLPYVSQTLDKLRDARYLTSLDIKSAYWQIPMAESSRPYTAFTVPGRGLFQFRRLPFGLHNAPATWQRFIDQVLGADLEPKVFVYLDDIIIVTQTFEEHLETLQEVLKRLRDAGLSLSRDKCQFCREELRFLGYVVNKQGLLVDPAKVQAILEIPTPKSVTEVRRLVGMASWYRRFVRDFSTVIAPLTNLLKKNTRFLWDEACSEAWLSIRDCLVSAPILSCPDFRYEFVVQCDSSDFGLGAVLTQTIDGTETVVCYLSRSLTAQERKYSTTEKECLAVLWSIEKLRPYVEGAHFTVITDHHSLLWLNRLISPSGRLARWSVRLQQYDFSIIHRKGKEHVVPDALSRSVPIIEALGLVREVRDKWYLRLRDSVKRFPAKYPLFQEINGNLCKYVRPIKEYFNEDANSWKIIVPREKRPDIIRQCHDEPTSGHLGMYKTLHRVAVTYYWPKMTYDIAQYVRGCQTCIQAKPEQRKPPGRMGGHSRIDKPWDVVSVDLVGPLPRTKRGMNYILVATDCFSKFTVTFALRRADTASVVKNIEEGIFLMFGAPRSIISDNGVQFRSREYRTLLNNYHVRPQYIDYYRPRANPVERVNRVIKTMLISYIAEHQRDWDLLLPRVTCALRSAKHEVTELTPYFVNFGREMHVTGERPLEPAVTDDTVPPTVHHDPEELIQRSESFARLYRDIKAKLQKAYEGAKCRYDLRRRVVNYLPNQMIWRRNFVLSDATKYFTAKLANKFIGPFLVHRKLGTDSYELKTCDGKVLPGHWSSEHLKAQPSEDYVE
jgi:transposase InsO family protein